MNAQHVSLSKSILNVAFVALVLIAASTSAFSSKLPSIAIVRGADQQTPYTSAFNKPLEVLVSNAVTKKPLAGIRINFTPAAGIGLTATSATTDRFGLASVNAIGLEVGASKVEAVVDGYPKARVDFDGLVVNKAVVTIIPASLNSNVGNIPAITTYTLTGFVKDQTAVSANVSGAPVLRTTATEQSPDANYVIVGDPGTLSAQNYTFVAGFGTLVLSGPESSSTPAAENGKGHVNNGSSDAVPSAVATDSNTEVVHAALAGSIGSAPSSRTFYVGSHRVASGVLVRAALQQGVPLTLTVSQSNRKPAAIRAALGAPGMR